MKKFWLIGAVALLPLISLAQPASVTAFFDKYSGQEGFTTVNITPKMFELIAAMSLDMDDPEAQAVIEMIENIEGMNILVYEGDESRSKSYFTEVSGGIPGNYYEELMSVSGAEENVKILIKESKKGYIDELLLTVSTDDQFVFLSLVGSIELAKIAEMASTFNMEGMEHLEHLKDLHGN
jgi:hypothetical protein